MNDSPRRKWVLAVSIVLLVCINRLPAPVTEQEESTPPPGTTKAFTKVAPSATKAPRATGSELDRFKGRWLYQESFPEDLTTSPPRAPVSRRYIMTIKDGRAVCEQQV